jgi:hypothetical protein
VEVPVIGSVHHQDVPTSGDVHLYSDPASCDTDTPILYADCEGLDGGERDPMSVKSRAKLENKKSLSEHRQLRRKIFNTVPDMVRARYNTSERDLLWATTEKTRSREYIVRNLYPRLLYIFSDTIVFVTKNPR